MPITLSGQKVFARRAVTSGTGQEPLIHAGMTEEDGMVSVVSLGATMNVIEGLAHYTTFTASLALAIILGVVRELSMVVPPRLLHLKPHRIMGSLIFPAATPILT